MTNKGLILKDIPAIPSKTVPETTRDDLYITRSVTCLHLQYFPFLSVESLCSHLLPLLLFVYSFSFRRTSYNKEDVRN